MPENLEVSLLEAAERLRTKQKLERAVVETRKSLAAEKERLAELGAVLDKEETDVRRLEGAGLTALFYQFLGRKEDQLDKERRELLAAKLSHDQCAHEAASLERDLADMEARLAALGDPETAYARALEEKGARIDGAAELAGLNADVKEIGEAVAAGDAVIAGLNDVIAYFKSAGNWGIVDLVGGGIIVTAVKHSKIDKAQAAIHEVQSRLGRFRRELEDVRTRPAVPLSVDITSFEKFADFIFDGLIFDWIVQSKIKRSLDAAMDMKTRMEAVVGDLRRSLESRRGDRDRAMRAKRAAIEQA